MKYFLLPVFIFLACTRTQSQQVYRFTGNGYWTLPGNWQMQLVPPDTLPAGDMIYVQPAAPDSCVLNKIQVIAPGATLDIMPGSNFIVQSGITITGSVPALLTLPVTSISGNYALSGGDMIANGGSAITDKGVVWSTSPDPDISAPTKTSDGSGSNSFGSYIRDLLPNTLYYVRAYATNSLGTAYGNQRSFTTTADLLPVLTLNSVDTIEATRASATGRVNSDLLAIITHGFCWDTARLPTTAVATKTVKGTLVPPFSYLWDPLTSLQPNTTYFIRAYATSSLGTAYSNQYSFTTDSLKVPALSAPSITGGIDALGSVTGSSTGSSNVSTNGSPVTVRGLCWDSLPNPVIQSADTSVSGSGTGNFSAALRNLRPNTTYYVRAYATNGIGTGYSNTTLIRAWMPRNLDVVTYRNGDTIPQISDSASWANATSGAWCYYNNDPANDTIYGKLYNYYALTDPRGLAPEGWRLPTEDDWNALSNLIPNQTGGRMKTITLWNPPNTGASNTSRFSGFPGGLRLPNANFAASQGYYAEWWSDFRFGYLFGRRLSYNNSGLNQAFTNVNIPSAMRAGRAVRCIKQ